MHQRDRRRATPRTRARTAHTPHTPHTPTPAPTARGQRAPAARPGGGQPGKGGRLNPDAPHHPCGGQPPTGHASHGASAGPPHPHTRGHSTWVADPDSPPRGRTAGRGGAPDLSRPLQRRKTPPPGDALPPPPQRATPARKGARCGAVAGSPRPHQPHPGHTGRGTPAARLRGRAAGGGTAPDTRRPSQRWLASPPGDGPPPPPRHAAPTGHASQGDNAGPPHPHTRAHSTWVVDPDSSPRGRAAERGEAPDLRCPSQWRRAPPPGTPFRHPRSAQRRLARAHAVGPVLGPHAHTKRTRDRRVAEPELPAPEDGRPGEGQRLTPDAPHNGGRPTPPGTAPRHPHGTQPPQGTRAEGPVQGPHTRTPAPRARGRRTRTARPEGGQSGEGEGVSAGAPHKGERHTPGDALPPPPQRATPACKGARCGARAGSPRPHQPHPGHTGRGTRLPAPGDGRPGEGQRLTPDAPHNGGRPPPPWRSPHDPHGTQPPQGMQAKGTVLGPNTRTPAPTARG